VCKIAEDHDLWLIEDCCDALGSRYNNRQVGTFGDLATLSFYPAHHITTGEGGAVISKDGRIDRIVTSIRDWGRDCYCEPGADNTCKTRYDGKFGDLPPMYDHKYVYSNLGYNLKITDMQAAVGLSQMEHLDHFVSMRKRNFESLSKQLAPLKDIFHLPEATEKSVPAWFGFPITIKEDAGIERVGLLKHLDRCKIGTRLLFGGNIIKQPYMSKRNHRSAAPLVNTDIIMKNTFWIGVYPRITEAMVGYMVKSIFNHIEKTRR
jgi:CDP-6-deoxy-D-xylo-4-hexulose-3-dehydrase